MEKEKGFYQWGTQIGEGSIPAPSQPLPQNTEVPMMLLQDHFRQLCRGSSTHAARHPTVILMPLAGEYSKPTPHCAALSTRVGGAASDPCCVVQGRCIFQGLCPTRCVPASWLPTAPGGGGALKHLASASPDSAPVSHPNVGGGGRGKD